MKIVTIVGARPQFIKAAVVSHELQKQHEEILVHTGQHFDYNMSEQFFEELDIPKPDYNLGISGGSHAQMTGRMMIAIEEILVKELPDWVLLYGDTNSTLAGALAAAKLYLPVCHVEAGIRTHHMENPEEINRICTDHISTLLLASTQSGMEEMAKEGLAGKSYMAGDTMYDAFIQYGRKKDIADIRLQTIYGEDIQVPEKYYFLTCHREENTKDDQNLLEICKAMERLDFPAVYPVHPRNRQRAAWIEQEYGFKNLILTEPAGYLENICLIQNAEKIITDSGGVQREAFFAEKKCVTVLDFVSWPETMAGGRNTLAAPKADEIIHKLLEPQRIEHSCQPFGDGHAAQKIVEKLEEKTGEIYI